MSRLVMCGSVPVDVLRAGRPVGRVNRKDPAWCAYRLSFLSAWACAGCVLMSGDVTPSLALQPRQVLGYAAAAAAGRLPNVPSVCPGLLTPATADHAFKVFLLQGGAGIAVLLALVEVVQRVGLGTAVVSLLILGSSGLLFVVLHTLWQRVGRAVLDELAHGYTTLTFTYVSFRAPGARGWYGTDWRVPWDYSGVWVLRPDGGVLSVPRLGSEPPGFFPSPHRVGGFELWSGAGWTGQFAADS